MVDQKTLRGWIGAVLAPEVRVAGTIASTHAISPSREYLETFPPAMVVAFGRTPAGAVSPTTLLAELHSTCAELGQPAPLVACDLEQGAGLHFVEGTRLPPALAWSAGTRRAHVETDREDLDWIRAAGECTAREARRCGVDLVLAPVADVNVERDNPIIAVRSFGSDPRLAAERAVAMLIGLHAGGAAACAKHFPGHGNTARDSHLELPRVERDLATLRAVEFTPFRHLIDHGVDAVMIAHLDVPALTAAFGCPTTLSSRAIETCLRGELGFRCVVLSDAMNMGALANFEPRYVRAIAAGIDGLLCPHDPLRAAEELLAAASSGEFDLERLRVAAERMTNLRDSRRSVTVPKEPFATNGLAAELAERALSTSTTPWPTGPGAPRLLAPLPERPGPEAAACLKKLDLVLPAVEGAFDLQVVLCEARAGLGRYGLAPAERAELEARIATGRRLGRPLALVWMGSAQSVPQELWSSCDVPMMVALAPTPPMFDAVGRWLLARSTPKPASDLSDHEARRPNSARG